MMLKRIIKCTSCSRFFETEISVNNKILECPNCKKSVVYIASNSFTFDKFHLSIRFYGLRSFFVFLEEFISRFMGIYRLFLLIKLTFRVTIFLLPHFFFSYFFSVDDLSWAGEILLSITGVLFIDIVLQLLMPERYLRESIHEEHNLILGQKHRIARSNFLSSYIK